MLVAFVRVPEGVTQEGHADLARNAQLEQSGVEGVAQVVKADIPDSRPANGGFPAGFEAPDRPAFEGEDQTGALLPA
jgi:hypothetical protein